jgi:phosphoserine phosphatase RsbU/P
MPPTPLPLPPGPALRPGRAKRAGDFLAWTWRGRTLLGCLGLVMLEWAGVPIPCGLDVLARVLLFLYCAWALFRLGRYLVRRLLWRIRTRLIVSYLFIAVVPVVLLLVLFGLAALFFTGLVASHIVTADLQAKGALLQQAARGALGADGPAEMERHLAAARAVHPGVEYAIVRGGRIIAASGTVPATLPAWLPADGLAGLVRDGERDELRAVARQGQDFAVVDAPLDARLLADLEQKTGIEFLGSGPTTEKTEITIKLEDSAARGMTSVATAERRRWTDGEAEADPLPLRFSPLGLGRRLSPSTLNVADLLMKLLALVAGVFLIVYVVALLLGLLLARTITRGIHELSAGTERLRGGDFTRPIRVHGSHQLGDLAESFNLMADSVRDLVRTQADKERLEEELRIAREIQMSLLPQGTVTVPGLRVAALCLPAAEVGGDYYDLLPLSATRLGVLIADVSGKGTSAALYMAELKGLVLSLSRIYESPARLLAEANRILAANMDPRSFITMTYAVVDTTKATMTYARAGHNPIIHLSDGRTRVLTPAGLGLGMDRGERFEEILEEASVPLTAGDVFLLFTDGLSEAMNGRAELFGERRLRDVLETATFAEADEHELKDRILEEIRRFVGDAAQHDDMTLVILKVL